VNFWDVTRLRLQYGNLEADEFADLLKNALRDLGRVETGKLHALMLRTAFDIRPSLVSHPAPDDMCWKYWLAMALRYLEALAQPKVRPNTVTHVQTQLERNRALCQLLLFGKPEQVIAMMPTLSASAAVLEALPSPTLDQAVVLDIIRYHVQNKSISERQIANWTTEMLEEWAAALQRRVQVPVAAGLSRIARLLVVRASGSQRAVDPSAFNELMTQFRDAGLDWAYGMALGYRNEVKRRYRAMERSAFWIASGGILSAVLLATFIATRVLTGPSLLQLLSILSLAVTFGLVLFHLARLILLTISISSALETQMTTLQEIEALFCSGDNDQSTSTSPAQPQLRQQRARGVPTVKEGSVTRE
jgi:hypothetical protein